jgi:hypothetical protein
MTVFTYYTGDELGAVNLWWRNSAGTLIDFSAGYTFEVRLGDPLDTATLTVTTGITGAAGAGSKPDGTPNVVIAWTAANLGSLTVPVDLTQVIYPMFVKATTATLDRHYPGELAVRLRRLPA